MKKNSDQLDCQEQGKIWDFTLFTNKQVNLPQYYKFWQKTHSSWARDKDYITHNSSNDQKWSEVKSLSRVQLFATPWTVAYKAPLSMEFSRQECWNGLPLPSPGDLPDPGMQKLYCLSHQGSH